MNKKLTTKEAYKVMYLFFDRYYERASSDDIGSLLSWMSFLQDESTADNAMWIYWIKAIDQVIAATDNELTARESFEATRSFLEDYQDRGPSPDVAAILAHMYLPSDRTNINPAAWKIWLECIADVNAGKGDFYLRLG